MTDDQGPSIRLSVSIQHQAMFRALTTERLPALLVSYVYLPDFQKHRHRYRFRDWAMDSGAFSALHSGTVIKLDAYIATCHEMIATDPTLTEVFALDVIGDHVASTKNCEVMWEAGIPAIPCFHYGEPESALMAMAERYPKIALGGVALMRGHKKLDWAKQAFARVWPKRIHGFGFASEAQLMALPFHSVDASSWESGACRFGSWRQFGKLNVRGTVHDLRGEVNLYLDLEHRARLRWASTMAELDTTGPALRLSAGSNRRSGLKDDSLAKLTPAPDIRLSVARARGGVSDKLARATREEP